MRLFVAVTPPDDVRSLVAHTQIEIPRARWAPSEQLHVTLRFIGETEPGDVDRIREALRSIVFSPFSLRIAGVGTFGHPARVLWCRLDPADEIRALAETIERSLVSLGLPPADREFEPHLTLARFKHSPPVQVRSYLDQNRSFESPIFSITEFTLFASQLSQHGATHSVVESYPLVARA